MPKGYNQAPQYINDPPTPKQLFNLTGYGIVLANEQQKLRASRSKKGAYFFMPEELSGLIVEDDTRETRQKIAGRIGKTGFRLWSLRMIDSFWAQQSDGDWGGVRSTYRFEWTDQQTVLSERKVKYVPTPEPIEFIDEIERFLVPDDITDIWHAEMQLQAVSGGDVEILTQSIADFGELSRSLAR